MPFPAFMSCRGGLGPRWLCALHFEWRLAAYNDHRKTIHEDSVTQFYLALYSSIEQVHGGEDLEDT